MRTGIYYNDATKEITSVTNGALPSEAGWTHLTDETQLGLLAVRSILTDRGLVNDDRAVYWHFPQPEQAGGPLPLLRCDVAGTRRSAGGWLGSLRGLLKGNRRPQLPAS